MYSNENFAERTKELVISRGERNLEIAEASFALSERGLETLRDFSHVAKRAELGRGIEEARIGVTKAESALAIAQAKAKISILRKQRAVTEAEQAQDKP